MFQMYSLNCANLHHLSCILCFRDREEMIPQEVHLSALIQIYYEAAVEAIISLLHIHHCPQVRVLFVSSIPHHHPLTQGVGGIT